MNNNRALFIASFMTLIAAGLGFAVRAGILGSWGAQYGFTQFELGTITGGGLAGFGIVILFASFITDTVGYKPLLGVAFVLHLLSAVVTLVATPVYNALGQDATYWFLYVGMFMFAVGNGLCEAVINPLVATLYPKEKTHYLNILHAGWPGGLIIGGLIAACFTGATPLIRSLRWEFLMAVFLLPTVIYGLIVLKEKFPVSEAKAAGVSYGQMLLNLASPLLIFLFLLHACVGYVELGTDSWITNITNTIAEGQGRYLFVYASTIMFVLRFFAGPIVEKINPLGLLFVSAALGSIGLLMIGMSQAVWLVWISVTVYGIGKTFLWPTMLGVVGERFPKGGAITMGMIGGIGMLSAGLLGGPGIGYKQDYYASKHLQAESEATYERYASEKPNAFLGLPAIKGLDNKKVSVALDKGKSLGTTVERLKLREEDNKEIAKINKWWLDKGQPNIDEDQEPVGEAVLYGGRMALTLTAAVPAFMAVMYLLLVIYFQMRGGYQAEVLHGEKPDGERYTGGVEGPVE
ncbi:MAG: MFS transporter [Gemmataceae bacterium]